MTLQLFACVMCAVVLLVGCGVQAGSTIDAADCVEVEAFFAIKDNTDALDQEIVDLRPATVTPESVRTLAPKYREAADEYGELLGRASVELERSQTAGTNFTPSWELLSESLTIRRDGFRFSARAFASPESFQDPTVVEELESWGRKTVAINSRLEESSTRFLREHGFEETDDGQFIVDC